MTGRCCRRRATDAFLVISGMPVALSGRLYLRIAVQVAASS